MTRPARALAWLVSLACPLGASQADFESAGVAGRWLNVEGSARSAAMASAMSAEGGGLEAMDFNPAGLASLLESQGAFTHWLGFKDSSLDQLALGLRLGEGLGLGLGLNAASFGAIERYSLEPGGPVARGTEAPRALALKAALGLKLGLGLGLGGGVTWLNQDLADASSSALAWDLGLRLGGLERGLSFGLSALKQGGSMDGYALPAAYRAGFSYRGFPSYKERMSLNLDALWLPGDADGPQGLLGLEYEPAPFIALRAGYRQGGANTPSGLSLGLGLSWSWASVDYAYARTGALSFVQQISLRIYGPKAHQEALSKARRARSREGDGEGESN